MDEKICSIIIPVFNVEKYLEECLQSVLQSVGNESEIILVLGNSHDSSNKICEKYCHYNSNIILLEQDGTGLSNARNCGLRIAKGNYVSFIDSDDYISGTSYSLVIEYLQKHHTEEIDVLLTDYVRVLEDGSVLETVDTLKKYDMPQVVADSEINEFLSRRNCFWNVWRYFYRRDFLLENGLWFLENHTTEDVDYTNRVLLKQKKMVFWHNPYYFYRTGRDNSLVNTVTVERVKDVTAILEGSITQALQVGRMFSRNLAEQYRLEYFLNIVLLADANSKEAIQCFDNWKCILKNSEKTAMKLCSLFLQFFGLKTTAIILMIFKRFRRYMKIRKVKRSETHEQCKKISQ